MDSVRKETHVVSVMIQRVETEAVRDKKDKRPLLHRKRRHILTERYLQKVEATEGEVLLEQEARFRADISSGESVRARNVIIGPPVCLNYKPESGCNYGDKCRFRHVEVDVQPSKKLKKSGVKGSVALIKDSKQLGCVSQDSHPRKSIRRKDGKLRSNDAVKFSKGTWHHKKIRE